LDVFENFLEKLKYDAPLCPAEFILFDVEAPGASKPMV
jgi:hypothetical protein